MQIRTKRAYDEPGDQDGARVLVDRIWPRGIKKEDLEIDFWLEDVAPSTELRKWFDHDPEKWEDFKRRYFDELDAKAEAVRQLAAAASDGRLTLVYGAKDEEHNNAAALKEYLEAAS